MWVEPIKNTFQSMLMLWVKGEKKVKVEGKRGNKGILKYLNGLFWIITPLEKKKKKSIHCFGCISLFSEEPQTVLNFSSCTRLHILLYS